MAKMTSEEFIQILNDSGLDFEVFGYEGILNMLSMYLTNEAVNYETRAIFEGQKGNDNGGLLGLMKKYDNGGSVIYHALENRGYYERRS